MFKVLKSELLKYLSGMMVYICAAITVFLSLADFAATKLITILSPEAVPHLVEKYATMTTQGYILNSLMSLFGGGSLYIVVAIVAATLISEDYGKGTMKYSLLATSKEKLILGKILTAGVINLIFIGASLIGAASVGFIMFNWGSTGYSVLEIMVAYFLGWLTLTGFSALVIFMINKISKISGAIGVGIGASMVLGMVGALIPNAIKPFVITANFGKVMDMSISSWGEVAFTNIGYILVFSILTLISFRKKEILY